MSEMDSLGLQPMTAHADCEVHGPASKNVATRLRPNPSLTDTLS